MNSEVIIAGTKRTAVLRTRQVPVIWRSIIVFFDSSLKMIGGELTLQQWLEAHGEWEIKNLSFDPVGSRWMLIGQRPSM